MNKKFIIFIILSYFAVTFLAFLSENTYILEDLQLNPFDYARITDVEYKAVVVDDDPSSEGKVVITERLTFDIHAASRSNLFWELWRDLPEDTVDGLPVYYQVNSVKQIMEDGTEIIYEESPVLYWDDEDYVSWNDELGPGKWYHSPGPYDEDYRRYECVFFYVDGLYREEVVFEIEYEMYNASLKYNDCSDLYLALYSGSTIKHLESFEAEILFPNDKMPAEGNYEVYSYGTNSNEFRIKESADRNPGYYTFYFNLDEEDLKFRPYNQYIEFDLVSYNEDKHIFSQYASINRYSDEDVLDEIFDEQQAYADAPEKFRNAKIIAFLILMVASGLVIAYAFTLHKRMNSKHFFCTPEMEMQYYREIPSDLDPKFATTLVFCKHKEPTDDTGIYSAILLSLARKKYIELREEYNNDVRITIKKKSTPVSQHVASANVGMTAPINTSATMNASTPIVTETPAPIEEYEPLTPCEEYYFNLLVRHSIMGEISMSTLQYRVSSDYESTSAFVKNMKNSTVNIGVKDFYFQKADYAQPKKQIQAMAKFLQVVGILFIVLVNIISYQTRMDLAFGAYFIFGICCIISSVYMKKQSGKYILLTQFGENEYAKWRGLYNFLNSETLMSERTYVELPLWERYLVYATAFGLSEKVINAISIRCPEVDLQSSPVLGNNCYRSSNFRHSSRSFRSSVRSGSSGSYGGGGGGFGYGGGGRGGGGGGGGH